MNNSELTRWTTPDYYVGFDPVGDYLLYARHRDSDILTNSNFEVMKNWLLELANKMPECPPKEDANSRNYPEGWIYTFTVSCWAHGWREYLLIRYEENDSDEYIDLVEMANHYVDQEKNIYPILDEMDYEKRQDDAMCNYWKSLSMEERIDLCKKHGHSIFSARLTYPPEKIRDNWYDSGEFN